MRLLSDITRHDIRNKLHALLGFLELSETLSTNPKMHEFLGKMRKISETIRLQMDFARDYHDLGILAPQWQSIEALVTQVRCQLDLGAIESYRKSWRARNLCRSLAREGILQPLRQRDKIW